MYTVIDELQKIITGLTFESKGLPEVYYVIDEKLGIGTNNKLRELIQKISCATIALDTMFLVLGALLTQAKELLPHGQFGTFVDSYCRFSRRHANNFMVAYKVVVDYPTLKSLKFSLLTIIGSKKFPHELAQLLADSIVTPIDMTSTDLLALQNAFINGEISLDGPELDRYLRCHKESHIQKVWGDEIERLVKQINGSQKKLNVMRDRHINILGPGSKKEINRCWFPIDKLLEQTIKEIENVKVGLQPPKFITYKHEGTVCFAQNKRGVKLGETLFNTDVYSLVRKNMLYWYVDPSDYIDCARAVTTTEEANGESVPAIQNQHDGDTSRSMITNKKLNIHFRDRSGNKLVQEEPVKEPDC